MGLTDVRIRYKCTECSYYMDSYYLYFKVGANYTFYRRCEKCHGQTDLISVKGKVE